MKTQFKMDVEPETVSALMDGQLGADEVAAVLPGMAEGAARECWQLYHLVGDVLRSTDLAGCGHDADFVRCVSERLQREAGVSRPAEAAAIVVPQLRQPAANDGVFRWKMVAGLASFAAVAAIGWGVMGSIGPQPGGAQLARQEVATDSTRMVAVSAPVPAEVASAAPGEPTMILRDPRLDEFLAAHRQAVGASALAGSAGFLRNATFEGSGR